MKTATHHARITARTLTAATLEHVEQRLDIRPPRPPADRRRHDDASESRHGRSAAA